MTRPGARVRSRLWLPGGVMLCMMCACASSPKVEYFTLAPGTAPAQTISPFSGRVQIVRVHVPSSLDREQLVQHEGRYTLDISDQHRWSAPLDQMVRRVLTEDLIRRLPAASVVLPQEPASSSTDKIVVDILEFAPDASGTIQLTASWSLVAANAAEAPQSRLARLSARAAPGDTADQVAAMSRALDELAAQMAQTLAASRTWSSARAPAP